MKKNIFFITLLSTSILLSKINTSYALENLTYTCPSSIPYMCNTEINSKKNDVSKKLSGISHQMIKDITKATSIKFNNIESKNIKSAIKKSSFKGIGQIESSYSDIIVGIPFLSRNNDIKYLFPPISIENIVLVKENASESINENILLNELKTHNIYITDEINLEDISNKIKNTNGMYHHTNGTQNFFNINIISNNKDLKNLKLDRNSSLITSFKNIKLIKNKNPKITHSNIKINGNNSIIALFIGVNKMSDLNKSNNKNILSKIKIILEDANK